jgi:fatty acid desaturase
MFFGLQVKLPAAEDRSYDKESTQLKADHIPTLPRAKIKIPLDANVFREHRKISSWKSVSVLTACYIATFLIISGFSKLPGLVESFDPQHSSIIKFAVGAFAFVLIAGIQGHLSILLHEGSHYLLHPNKRVNGILAELAGIPVLFTAKNYRALHLAHHEHSGDLQLDPERQVYKDQGYTYTPAQSWGPVIRMLLQDLFVINAIRFLNSINNYLKSIPGHKLITGREVVWFIAVHGLPLAIAFGSGFGVEYLVLWYGPLFTLTFFFLKLHIYGEHTGLQGPTEFQRTWHHRSNPIFDFFVYPIRSGFHLEHHLYPSIPWYNMRSFRNELMKHPEFAMNQQLLDADGYFVGKNTIWNSMIKGQRLRNSVDSNI